MTYNPPTFASIDLLPDYQQIRKQTEHICAPLQTEDYTVQPITDVSPPKWHLGHTTWFFENFVLIPQLDQYQPFNLDLNYFFNSYYESQGWLTGPMWIGICRIFWRASRNYPTTYTT